MSSSVKRHSFMRVCPLDRRLDWVSIAPFDLPVVPDVYSNAAKSSSFRSTGSNSYVDASAKSISEPVPFALSVSILIFKCDVFFEISSEIFPSQINTLAPLCSMK